MSKMSLTWIRNETVPLFLLSLLFLITACQSPAPNWAPQEHSTPDASLRLAAGDVLQISFPGASNLNTSQKIRVDGKISLPLIGEYSALGKTPAEAQEDIAKLYAPQLQVKEVLVAVESSSVPVYVGGAVMRQGRILSDRPITALEAIMEAGGFDQTRAKMSRVVVIRHQDGKASRFFLNLDSVLKGTKTDVFYLKPNDIIYVPQKRVIF